jgi:pentatricopeptide repeat protein
MIDACVSNNRLDYALELFNDYKFSVVQPNAIMYSTLLKGFALERRAEDALAFIDKHDVQMNEVGD